MGRSARSLIPPVRAHAPRDRATAAGPQGAPRPSAARTLQIALAGPLSDHALRWSPRRTACFVLLTCGGFWLAAATAAANLLR